MKRTSTLLGCCLFGYFAQAQCETYLPYGLFVPDPLGPPEGWYTSPSAATMGPDARIWICKGWEFHIMTFGGARILAEADTYIEDMGSNDSLWVQDHSHVLLTGDNNVLYYDATTTVEDLGQGNTLHLCDTVIITYAPEYAGILGCFYYDVFYEQLGVGLAEADDQRIDVVLAPNPVVDEVNLRSTGTRVTDVRIRDAQGRMVRSVMTMGRDRFGLGMLPAGVYFAELRTDNGTFTRRFVKQ